MKTAWSNFGGATIRVVGLARMIGTMLTGRVRQGRAAIGAGLAQLLSMGRALPCHGPCAPPCRDPAADRLRCLPGDQPHAEHVGATGKSGPEKVTG
jgi:hypothetical protein